MTKRTLTICLSAAISICTLAAYSAEKERKAVKVDTSKLPPPASRQGVTYAADIKPILEKSCFGCHGPQKQKGKLRLDSLEAALKGSENGKVIEAKFSFLLLRP